MLVGLMSVALQFSMRVKASFKRKSHNTKKTDNRIIDKTF